MLALTRDLGETPAISTSQLPTWIYRTGLVVSQMLLPFLLLLLVIALVGSYVQSGLVMSWKKLKPDLSNLSPAKGLKRIFSKDSLTRTGMGLIKMTLVAAVAWVTIAPRVGALVAAGMAPVGGVFHFGANLIGTLALRLALVLLLLGLIDYLYHRWSLNQTLKMTKQEVRDEMKRMEGDPLVKQRRRRVQAKLAMQRIGLDVPRADVVVTNPTEFAVALRYDEATMSAPRVLAKGQDLLALHIRQIARQHGVPIVQRPPLARALYAACEPGDEVPATYYRAVAEVLAYVYQLARAGRAAG
jgi:flagellar biosynthetic protein FlhB